MKVLSTWSDDHLPCIEFEHNAINYQLWWTDRKLEGILEVISEGDLSVEAALKNYPQLLAALNGDFTGLEQSDDEEEGVESYHLDVGMLEIRR